MKLNLIAAVGKQGQLGVQGHLPWVDTADLQWFQRTTMGSVVIMGQKTINLIPPLPGRILHPYAGRHATPKDTLLYVRSAWPGWKLWVAGGEKTYRDFAPYVDGLKLINYIDYEGEADAWFPFDAYNIRKGESDAPPNK
jgi:dihydrofolate reductase